MIDLKVKILAFVIKMNNWWIGSWWWKWLWNWLDKQAKQSKWYAAVNEKDKSENTTKKVNSLWPESQPTKQLPPKIG